MAFALGLAAVAWLAPLDRPAAAQSGYTLIELSGTDGAGPASDINDSGKVVGYHTTIAGYEWTLAGGVQPLSGDPALAGLFPIYDYFPRALSIGPTGIIVGKGWATQATAGGPTGPARWTPTGGYEHSGILDGTAAARAVNSAGVTVGLYRGNSSAPFIWRPGEAIQILPGFAAAGGSDAFDINEAGTVVGRCQVVAGCVYGSWAFRWTEAVGTMPLPKIQPQASLYDNYEALAVNDEEEIVGRFYLSDGLNTQGVFYWSAATGTIDLQAPAGSPEFLDINDAGDIVATIIQNGYRVPYLYRGGTWTNINDLRPAGSTMVLQAVRAINNRGWMIGDAASGGSGWVLLPPVAGAPEAQDDTLAVTEDTPAAGQLQATDPNGDALTFALVDAPALGVVVPDGATGAFTYTPAANVSGDDAFTFQASDGTGTSNVATITVSIAPANDAPVAADGAASTTAGTPVSGTLVATDVDSATLNYSVVTNGALGVATITDATTGAYTYTPNGGASGTDTFTFRVSDGGADSNDATITITIAANRAPVASNGTVTTSEDRSVNGRLSASDVDGDPLTFALVSNGTRGTATITNVSTGRFSYVPAPNANGTDTFTFQVSDGSSSSNVATVTVTIAPQNDAPVASDGAYSTSASQPVGGVLAGADADGDPLTFNVSRAPRRGTVSITDAGTGAFIYTPNAGFVGSDRFAFRVTDASGASATATITIAVQ